MTSIDLFAGCGGAGAGLRRAGVGILASYERDPDACATQRAAWPGHRVVQADLSGVDGATIPAADLWWASPPCQPDSTAGLRRGDDDPRDGWPILFRLLREARLAGSAPTWVACETVRGILPVRRPRTAAHHRRAERWQRILAGLREGYPWVDHRVLDAADYGVPQRRRRVIIIAGPRPVAWPAPTHGPTTARPWVSMGQALGLAPAEAVIGGGRNPGRPPWWHRASPPDEPSRTIGTRANASILLDPSPTVSATEHKGAGARAVRASRGEARDPRGTVDRASCALLQATGRRRLTIAECAILQDLAHHPIQGSTKASRYRQIGNAVPPTLAAAVARSVLDAALGDR